MKECRQCRQQMTGRRCPHCGAVVHDVLWVAEGVLIAAVILRVFIGMIVFWLAN